MIILVFGNDFLSYLLRNYIEEVPQDDEHTFQAYSVLCRSLFFLYQLNFYGSWLLSYFPFLLYFHQAEPLLISLVVAVWQVSCVLLPSNNFPACISPAPYVVPFWAHIPWQGLLWSMGYARLNWHKTPSQLIFSFVFNKRKFERIEGISHFRV